MRASGNRSTRCRSRRSTGSRSITSASARLGDLSGADRHLVRVERGDTIAFVGRRAPARPPWSSARRYTRRSRATSSTTHSASTISLEPAARAHRVVTPDTQLFSAPSARTAVRHPAATVPRPRRAAPGGVRQPAGAGRPRARHGDWGGRLKVSVRREAAAVDCARAAAPAAPCSFLTSATSSLDSLTEEEIGDTIPARWRRGRRHTILIAHRLSRSCTPIASSCSNEAASSRRARTPPARTEGLVLRLWRQQIGERRAAPATPPAAAAQPALAGDSVRRNAQCPCSMPNALTNFQRPMTKAPIAQSWASRG